MDGKEILAFGHSVVSRKYIRVLSKRTLQPPVAGATELELKQNKADLEFETEYILNKEPVKMDMLIIKKQPDVTIKNEIGRIFRGHNIVEFKGSGDVLNIDVYHKVIAYACLYKSMGRLVDERPAKDITVTMIREAYPRELFKTFAEADISFEERFPGIYYLTGNVMFPTQIIVTRRLSDEHASLRILSKQALGISDTDRSRYMAML